ncbi:unnamed protein product [Cochlearia groenlandica]
MGSRIKEDERTEKAIRSLLKLPENRRCINCNSLGPQYVCSTFWTFVCINCSGIHREFTHRVKSISMAKFTAEEVSELRAGGNERARQIFFKEWDTRRDVYPDSSNIFKLRDFIRSVYVDKRYSSESNDKITQMKPAFIEDNKASTKLFGSRSLQSLYNSETERSSIGGRIGSNESLQFYFDEKKHKKPQQHVARGLPKSPIRFEIVDDRFRDDGSVKRYDARREPRGNSKSLDLSNNNDSPRFPIVRHASEILGENAPPLRVENIVKAEKNKDPVTNQVIYRYVSVIHSYCYDVNKLQFLQITTTSNKMESPVNLLDDVPVSKPSDENISKSSNEITTYRKAREYPAPTSLEDLLFGPSGPSGVSGTNNYVDNYPEANLDTHAMPGTPENVSSFVTSLTISPVDNLNTKDIASPSSSINFGVIHVATQVEFSSPPKEAQDFSMEHSTLAITNYAHGVESEHQNQDDTQSSIRSALPEDLFTGGFSFASPQVHGMGYGMQYYQYPMNTGAFTYAAKTSNPFDISCDDTGPNQTSQFPSIAYEQGGGYPHMSAPRGYSDFSNQPADSMGLMTFQSPSYATALSPTSPSLAHNLSSGEYISQQSHMNMSPSFRQEMNGFGSEETTFNASNSFHQENNGYTNANQNAYISRGNPFE